MKFSSGFSLVLRVVLSGAVAVPAVIFSAPVAWAQAPGAPLPLDQQDFENAGKMVDAGDLKGAAALYEGIPTKYPTSPMIPQSKVRLGYVYFRQNEYDRAVKSLQAVAAAQGVPPELVELALSLIPQVLSAKAASMGNSAPPRKTTFEEAVKAFDTFLQKFPRSDEVETINYGKAVALYQLGKYDPAKQALAANLTAFPKSQTVLDSQYLLALTMGTTANVAAKVATAKDPTIEKDYDNSEKMLADVVNKGQVSDVALANDARFQIGEMLFARAGFAKDDNLAKTYFQRSLDAYRAVTSKEVVVAAQKNRIERLKALRQPALVARDEPLLKRLPRIVEREQEKLAAIEGRPEQTIAAQIKMGEIFFRLKRYDETRVMLGFAKPKVQDEDQKKDIAYFTSVSLATQNMEAQGARLNAALGERAVAAYQEFQTAYKNDAMGENLALLVGAGFVAKEPEKAIKFFEEQIANYPKSPLVITAQTQMAAAYAGMGQNDEALKMFRATLEKKPEKDVAAAAEFGIATILQKTGKTTEASAQFKKVRDGYAGTPQAEQATYFYGQVLFESGDAKAAASELQSFIKSYGQNELMPQALFFLAQAQRAQNLKSESMATYQRLAKDFPKSETAPYSYFERARILMDDSKADDVLALMRSFIETYPDSEKLYQAYDFMAQLQVSQKQEPAAIATYEEFAKSKAEDPNAPQALLRVSTLWKEAADKLGRYTTLSQEQRPEWTADLEKSVKMCERIVRTYPESGQVALALNLLLDCLKLREGAKLSTEADTDKYFQDLAEEFKDKPATRSKIVFTQASNIYEKDKDRAVGLMTKVYDPAQMYAPEDLDLYSAGLIDQKKLDDAEKVFSKLAKDYKIPDGVEPNKAATNTQIAQSISIFGLGKVLQERGKVDEARAKFDELEKLYGWSPKMLEANYGIALSLFKEQKSEDALKRLSSVIKAPKAEATLRAKAMLLLAEIHEEMKNYDDAISNYSKISTFYGGVPKVASEGLWHAAQLLEKQSTGALPIPTPTPRPTAAAAAKKPAAPAAK